MKMPSLIDVAWLPSFLALADPSALPNLQTTPEAVSNSPEATHLSLLTFDPNASCVKRRRIKVSVDVSLSADKLDNIEFYTILTVNGSPERPFVLSMLPGDADAVQRAVWYVRLNNKKSNEVKLEVLAIRGNSGRGERVIEATRHYRISRRSC
jgi:hypothetical protein